MPPDKSHAGAESPDIVYSDQRVEFAMRFYQILKSRGIDVGANPLIHSDSEISKKTDDLPPYSVEPTDRTTLIVPGLLGNSVRSLVAPLFCAKHRLTVKGYQLKIAWVSGRSGCDHNAKELRKQVLECAEKSGKAVNVVGYSKGCADALHMLGNYNDTHSAVATLVSYAGAVLGSPLAASTPGWMNSLLRYLPLPGESSGDGRAIADLWPQRRRDWLLDNPLPSDIRLASIVAAPDVEMISRILKSSHRKLAAWDTNNDSQVIFRDALLPNSELLAVVNADHWAIALPIAERHRTLARLIVDKNEFPRDVLIQATIDHLSETA